MGPDAIHTSALVALAELALTGCVCSSDHLYMFPNGARLDDEIEAADMIGVRLHAARGSMSIGESDGGLPPDSLVENETAILKGSLRAIQTWHDPNPVAMIRVAVAPCSPFSVSQGLMRDAAMLARDQGVMLHTQLAENDDDVAYSHDRFGCSPGDYAADVGWVGDDVWHAHCVKLDAPEIALFAEHGVSFAHCPCSNMRLGSGIAPIGEMLRAGVNVGLGVDGSASKDSGHLMNEARQAMLLQRVANVGDAMSARTALELATRGGAKALGRDDLGSIEIGKRADFAAFRASELALSGAWDRVVGLLLAGPLQAWHTVIEGKFVVQEVQVVTIDLPSVLAAHHQISVDLMNG